MHETWKTPGAVVAEQRTLKAQMRRQQKVWKKPRSHHVPNLPASLPDAKTDVVQLPGSNYFAKNATKFRIYFVAANCFRCE